MNVFIGGSRAVAKLNPAVRDRLDDLIRRNCTILIGDANGADKAVQQHLAARGYSNVVVFCMEECRNNAGNWPLRHIKPPGRRRDFTYYAAKDLAMFNEADYGVMLWDAKSKGTLQNILNLVRAGKRTLVYVAPSKEFRVLANNEELQALLSRCEQRHLDTAARGPGVKTALPQPHLPLSSR